MVAVFTKPALRYTAKLPQTNECTMVILCAENLCSEPATLSTGWRHQVTQASLSTVRGTASVKVYYMGKQMISTT